MAETVGNIQVVASINTKDYDAGKKSIEKGNAELESGAKKTSKGFSAAWIGAVAGVASALTNTFLGAVRSSIGGAVRRVDTLNNSTRTFENMGIGAEESSKSMKALNDSILGLPTPLDSAVRGMTALTATYGDIDKGQRVFSALNNAILGFGGSADMVDNAITQLSQLPMDGPLDAQTWNSLRNSGITPVLSAMAKDSGMSVAEMKKAFGDGELTVEDFTDRLLKLNKEGGGGLQSLEKIAKDSTKGISTGFANMQTSITRGVGKIIESIGSENISKALANIGSGFESTLSIASTEIGNFIPKLVEIGRQVLEYLMPKLTAFWNTLNKKLIPALKILWKDVIEPLAPVIGTTLVIALGLALDAMNLIITAISGLITGFKEGNPLIIAAAGAFGGLATAMIFTKVFAAMTAGFNTLRLVTIPNTIASYKIFAALVTSPIGIVIAVGAALAAIAAVFKALQDLHKQLDELNLAQKRQSTANDDFFKSLKRARDEGRVTEEEFRRRSRAFADSQSETNRAINRALGFASGGFTGRGNRNEPAGIVHRGEYVIPKDMVNQNTGLPKLSMLGSLLSSSRSSIPLSKLDSMLNRQEAPTQSQNIQPVVKIPNQSSADYRQGAINTIKAYNEYLRSVGKPQIGVQA